MKKSEKQLATLEITRASLEQKQIMANLLELYTHDFCEFIDREIGADGRFGCFDLDLYWTDPDWLPFFVNVDRSLAGFIVIKASHQGARPVRVWDVAEFFILRGYRRQGIGIAAAHQIWKRFPGTWEVRVITTNEPAYRFWHYAIKSFAGDEFQVKRDKHGGSDWHRFLFESRPVAENRT